MTILHFTNCYLADYARLTRTDLFVDAQQGIIISEPSASTRSGRSTTVETIDLDGCIISPGFIDIQINGCFGLDYSATFKEPNDKADFVNHYTDSMQQLLQYGVTSIVPTVTSSFEEVYKDVLLIVGLKTRSTTKADSLGAHIEGPFISPLKKGCHPPETLTTMSNGYDSLKERYGDDFEKYTAIMTAAPEVDGCLDIIHPLTTQNDIVFSIGHTMASFETGIKAIRNGASMITHLYNAMPSNSARNPGIVGLTTIPKDVLPAEQIPYYGLVADGIHVHPSNIKASYFANSSKAILVTDAMYLIGLSDGIYERGDQRIEKKAHLLHLQGTDTIAGSATHLLECVKNLMQWTGVPLEKALATITNNPARSLKISQRKGFLNKGCDADLVVLSPDGVIKNVYKLGNKVL